MTIILENIISSMVVAVLIGIWRTGANKLRSIETRLTALEQAVKTNGK